MVLIASMNASNIVVYAWTKKDRGQAGLSILDVHPVDQLICRLFPHMKWEPIGVPN